MEINKRIITLIEILGLTPGEFADKINVQRSGISHITSGRNKPSLDFLERTLSVFPDINSEWLILGKGKPLKFKNEELKEDNNSPPINKNADLESQSPLLFPMDDFTDKSPSNENKTESIAVENNIGNTKYQTQKNESVEEKYSEKKNREKKDIKKIIVLYKDNSFEVYES